MQTIDSLSIMSVFVFEIEIKTALGNNSRDTTWKYEKGRYWEHLSDWQIETGRVVNPNKTVSRKKKYEQLRKNPITGKRNDVTLGALDRERAYHELQKALRYGDKQFLCLFFFITLSRVSVYSWSCSWLWGSPYLIYVLLGMLVWTQWNQWGYLSTSNIMGHDVCARILFLGTIG